MVRIYNAAFAAAGSKHHWHLDNFWWIDAVNKTGQWTRQQAYDYVMANPGIVYVAEGRASVFVYPMLHKKTDTKWVQTYADGVWKDNLTALAVRHSQGLVNL